MKKIVLTALIGLGSLLSTSNLFAQSFTIEADTVKAVVSGYVSVSDKITNTALTGTIKVNWKVVSHNLPNDWQSVIGICDNVNCYNSSILGTSAVPGTPPFTPPGDIKITDTFSNGHKCDFHIQSDFSTCSGGGPYYIRVELTEGTTTKYVTFALTKWAAGINNTAKNTKEVTVYPNPAHGELNVLYDRSLGVKNIAVVNLIGKVVSYFKVSDDNSAKLNIENLVSGVYLINLIDAQGQKVATKRFTTIQ